jgi:hypothetical protein
MNIDEAEVFSIAVILGLAIVTVAKWLVYTGLLWGMIKIQKLNYNVLGLFGSSLAATLVAFIPYVGSYLSYVVLVLCLWKCTGADIAPDVIFTVGIASALMFCVNLFVIGALMGNIRPDLAANARADSEIVDMSDEMEDSDDELDDAENNSPLAKPSAPATTAKPVPLKAGDGSLVLKGISSNANGPLVMISAAGRVYTLTTGETFTVTLPKGKTKWVCEQVTRTSAIVKSDQGEQFELQIQ